MTQHGNYLFTSTEERYKRMNRFLLLAVDLLFLILLFYQTIQVVKPDRETQTTSWNIVLLIIFAIANIIVFKKKPHAATLKLLAVIEIGLEFIILSINPTATFLSSILVGVLAILIPYYDSHFYNITLITYSALYTISQAFRIGTKIDSFTASTLCVLLITYALFVVLVRVGSVTKMFSDHALASSNEQSENLSQLLNEILEISRTIKEESDASTRAMQLLFESARNTTNSMEQISHSTNITAENIEEQTGMTQNIQSAIEQTMNNAQNMVAIATTSSEKIAENQQIMSELKIQSAQVCETNQQVTSAMAKLGENTREVENIAAIILNISNQTNLLALNASIESARAGEAGRGFAIVAEQIRQLSEETRCSTESITGILAELNKNADEVVEVIDQSVAITNQQNDQIVTATESFMQLEKNLQDLIRNIHEIDNKIEHLSEANNTIVENITNLSATTEEVTAIADETNQLSKSNLEYTEQVQQAIAFIQENAERLNKYSY